MMSMYGWMAALVAGMALMGGGVSAQSGRAPLSAETMWKLQRVGEPSLSPDGKQAVVAVTRYDLEGDRSLTSLYLIPTDGGRGTRQLTSGEGNDISPVWSPDGQWIAFVSRRPGDTASQIYVIPPDGGEARRLTSTPTGASSPKWFPDSGRIAFISAVWPDARSWDDQARLTREAAEPKMTARAWDKAPFAAWDRYLDAREPHLFAVALQGGEPANITRGSGRAVEFRSPGADDFDISPDGLEIAFVSDADTSGVRPNHDLFTVPVAGGTAMNRTAGNPAGDNSPRYSPDGTWLAWTANAIPGAPDRERVMVLDRQASAATARDLTGGWDHSAAEIDWLADSRGLVVVAEDRPTRRAFIMGLDGATPRRLTGEGDFGGVALAGGSMVALRSSFTQPPTLVRVDPGNGRARVLSRFNDALLSTVKMGEVDSVTYKGANGADIQMWVVKPPDFSASKRYPLFLLLHGGPHVGITDQWAWRWNAQVFAGWGYVTAWHNFHGSSGFGDAFADAINPDWASLPYEDTIKAVDWFKAQRWIDDGRLVAGGGSYGGYLATLLLGREHPFKALVAHASVYNSYTQVAADYGANRSRHYEFWTDPAAFQARSPHMAAANFRTPTLVIHGQQDLRVPVTHSFELFNALQNRGVPSRMVYYPNENHWVLRPQNSLNWYGEVRTWIERHAPPGGR